MVHTNKIVGKFFQDNVYTCNDLWTRMLANLETTNAKNECSRDEKVDMHCSNTRKARIKNEHIWYHFGVASIGDKLSENHLRCWRCLTQANNGPDEEKFFYTC